MKKVKLFTTIASLCLAVALMAFGVYAAANVNVNVSSTVTVNANGISGTWYVNEEAMSEGTTNNVDAPNAISSDEGSIVYTVEFVAGEGVEHTANVTANMTTGTYFAVSTVKGEGDTWTVTVTLTDAAKGGKLTAQQTDTVNIICTAEPA